MSPPEVISSDLRQLLRRLKLSPMLATLPERLHLARAQNLGHHDFLELILADEVERRTALSNQLRARKAKLDPTMQLEAWDETAGVTYDRRLLSELVTLRWLEAHHNVLLLGPVGVGKTHVAMALGHIACRRAYSVIAARTEQLLKKLKVARLDHTYEREMRRLVTVDLLILDDFAIDVMDAIESRDIYELIVERHHRRSVLVTSNRTPEEWLATMADPFRAQSAIDRLTNAAFELVIEGESYRSRQKPRPASAEAS